MMAIKTYNRFGVSYCRQLDCMLARMHSGGAFQLDSHGSETIHHMVLDMNGPILTLFKYWPT